MKQPESHGGVDQGSFVIAGDGAGRVAGEAGKFPADAGVTVPEDKPEARVKGTAPGLAG